MIRGSVSELPRLLFCCFDVVPAPSATSRRLSEYLDTLSERYQVVALTVKTPDHSHIERYRGARLLRVPVGAGDLRSRMESFDRAVRRQLESEEYLMVHFFDPVSGYPLCERRADFGYRLVYDACRYPSSDLPSLAPQEGSNKRLLARSRRQELFCLLNADAIIVGSEAAKAHAVGLGVPSERLHVLRAPVDLAPFTPEVLGSPRGTPARLIHLSSHGRHQDLPTLFAALAASTSGAKLALVGPSSAELTGPLKARASELGLGDRVEFQDPVAHADLHKVLAAADIGVVTLGDEPRNRTTTSLARVSEYLAAGRPIIAADLPLTRELIPAEAARFYPPGDVAALAAAIDALATDPDLRETLGAAARTAASVVDAKRIRERLIEIYELVAPSSGAAVASSEEPAPDATQLGEPLPLDENEVTQAAVLRTSPPPDVGTNKVKTDPAVVGPPPDADTGTDRAQAKERPAVMGVLLRDPPSSRDATDPALSPSKEPPVVMGSPVHPPERSKDSLSHAGPQVKPELAKEAPTGPGHAGPPELAKEPTTGPGHTGPLMQPELAKEPPTGPGHAGPLMQPELAKEPPTGPGVAASVSSRASPVPFPTVPELGAPTPAAPPPLTALPADDEPLDFATLLKPSAPPARPAPSASERKAPATAVPVPTSFSLPGKEAFVPPPRPPSASTSGVRAVQPVSPTATASPSGAPPAAAKAAIASSPSGLTAPTATNASPNGLTSAAPKPAISTPSGLSAATGTNASPNDLTSAAPPKPGIAVSPSGLSAPSAPNATIASAPSGLTVPSVTNAAITSSPSGLSATPPVTAKPGVVSSPSSLSAPTGTNASPSGLTNAAAPKPGIAASPSGLSAPTGTNASGLPNSAPAAKPGSTSSPSGVSASPAAITSSPSGLTSTTPKPASPSATGLTTASNGAAPPPLPKSRGSGAQPEPAGAPKPEQPPLSLEPTPPPEPTKPAAKPERRSSGSKVGRAKGKIATEATPTTPAGAKLADNLPPLSRLVPNPDPTGAPAILTREADDADVPHVDEVELVNDESFDSLPDDDDHEIDAQELHALETSAAPPDSRLDPWFAQLVHGYCPPESQLFTRHVPPTTMPGRDT